MHRNLFAIVAALAISAQAQITLRMDASRTPLPAGLVSPVLSLTIINQTDRRFVIPVSPQGTFACPYFKVFRQSDGERVGTQHQELDALCLTPVKVQYVAPGQTRRILVRMPRIRLERGDYTVMPRIPPEGPKTAAWAKGQLQIR